MIRQYSNGRNSVNIKRNYLNYTTTNADLTKIKRQAQSRAATETAALIHVFRRKVQFLFHLEITFGDEVYVL